MKRKSVNTKLHDEAVRRAVFTERLKNGEVKKFGEFLSKTLLPDVIAKVETRLKKIKERGYDLGPESTRRLKELRDEILVDLREGMRSLGADVRGSMVRLGVSESEWMARTVKSIVPVDISFRAISLATIEGVVSKRPFEGKLLKDWFDDLAVASQKRVISQVRIGLASGEAIPNIAKRLTGTASAGFGDGVAASVRRNAESVVRTALNHVSTQVREDTYLRNEELIKGVQIVATLDDRTTPICRSYDGKVFAVNEGPRPPFHFACRTTTIPVLKSFEELGFKVGRLPEAQRASMDGLVAESVTYPEWLRSQSAKSQDAILGPSRGELFRSGRVSIDRFVNDRGQTLTLDQLDKLN